MTGNMHSCEFASDVTCLIVSPAHGTIDRAGEVGLDGERIANALQRSTRTFAAAVDGTMADHLPRTSSCIRMRNPLQDQLLKAGLVKKDKVAQVVREQAKQRHGKAPAPPSAEHVDAQRLQAERAERDRALAAEQNAQARISEQRAQVRQIIETHKVKREGEIAYRFSDEGKIRSVLVNEILRSQLASGLLVIARHDQGYELLPRNVADKVYARAAGMIVLDHGLGAGEGADADDAYYERFKVPDDLIW